MEEDDNVPHVTEFNDGPFTQNSSCPTRKFQLGEQEQVHGHSSSLLNDIGKREDFVLVYEHQKNPTLEDQGKSFRKVFEENLVKHGLELEYEDLNGSVFLKIHAPESVLKLFIEQLQLCLPLKRKLPTHHNDTTIGSVHDNSLHLPHQAHCSPVNRLLENVKAYIRYVLLLLCPFQVDVNKFPPSLSPQRFTAVYSREQCDLFETEPLTPAMCSFVVQYILDYTHTSLTEKHDFETDLSSYYTAIYPVHDGNLEQTGSARNSLYQEWASLKKILHYQPLDFIKNYLGIEMGLYFACLGFYTSWLLLACIAGVSCFGYGVLNLHSHQPSEDICNKSLQIKMCPRCDDQCDYWSLDNSCPYKRVTYLFDNESTVICTFLMSLWGPLFLEFWKTFFVKISYKWDMTMYDISEEHPQMYAYHGSKVERKGLLSTDVLEPQLLLWCSRFCSILSSFSVVFLILLLLITAVGGILLYKLSIYTAFLVYGDSYALLYTSVATGVINFFFIKCINLIYKKIARILTERECHRTQAKFDNSLWLKDYLLKLVSNYVPLFYIAIIKGRFTGHPGKYFRIFGVRLEECGAGGCQLDLCIQLAIIMVGEKTLNTLYKFGFLMVCKWRKARVQKESLNVKRRTSQWISDYELKEWGRYALFPEYLDVVLQYSFVSVFFAAFPLVPVVALLINIMKIRLDAQKFLRFYRRPVSRHVSYIGLWYCILKWIGKISVLSNACIMAFTSNFIPQSYFKLYESKDESLNGFLNHSLAFFNVSDFEEGASPNATEFLNITTCRYLDYREPPWKDNKYDITVVGWQVTAARFLFVFVYVVVAWIIVSVTRWCVGDMSSYLLDPVQHKTYLVPQTTPPENAKTFGGQPGLSPNGRRTTRAIRRGNKRFRKT